MIHEDIDFYKGLAIYILPDGVTNYFDLVDFSEEPARKGDQLYKTELHLYLDERDNRPEAKQNAARTSFYRHLGSVIMLIEKFYSGFTGVTSDPPSPPSSGVGSGSTSSPFFFRRLCAICSSIFLMS